MDEYVRWPLFRNMIRRNSEKNTFGKVRRDHNGAVRVHQGWDFYASVGTPCYAIATGEVEFVGSIGDFGSIVVSSFIFEDIRYFSAYAHLSSVSVSVHQKVQMGSCIGLTGSTGNAVNLKGEDEHLHFEIRTVPLPGHGLGGRVSPIRVFKVCPLYREIISPLHDAALHTFIDQGVRYG